MGWESKPRSFCLLLIFTPSVLTLLVLMLLVLIMRMRGAGVRPAFGGNACRAEPSCLPAVTLGRTGQLEGLVAVAVAVAVVSASLVLFRLLDDEGFSRQEHAGDGGGVLHRGAGDLDRVDDALGYQVAVLAGGGVVAVADGQFGGLGDHDGALLAGVQRDPASRLGQRPLDDGHAGRLVAGLAEVVEASGH